MFSGADAFKLYDTYGFPIDLTVEMVEDEGMTVDRGRLCQADAGAKVRAREARKALGDLAWAGMDLGLDNTPQSLPAMKKDEDTAKVLAVCVDGEVTGVIAGGEAGILVLDRTPFYAEMGGQTADHGSITVGQAVFAVTNVQKDKGGKYLHHGKLLTGEIKVDDEAVAAIDRTRRAAIRRAHSATHLLQSALVKVLGDHCHQAGSLVEPDRLRFDFTHYEAISREDLKRIEEETIGAILSGTAVETLVLPLEEAKKLGGDGPLWGEVRRHRPGGEDGSTVFGVLRRDPSGQYRQRRGCSTLSPSPPSPLACGGLRLSPVLRCWPCWKKTAKPLPRQPKP